MSIEGMKIPGVSGTAPTGRNVGHAVSSQGHSGDANSRSLSAGARAQSALPAKQQRNTQKRAEEQNRAAAFERMGGARSYATGKATPAGQIPGGPNKLQQAQAAYGAANPGHLSPKQFSAVSPSVAMKGAIQKLRMMKRLRVK